MTWSFSAEQGLLGDGLKRAGVGQLLLGIEAGLGAAPTSTVEGEKGGVHRHTHRGSEGPAATFGKSWLSPGEESEGKMPIEPRVGSGWKGVCGWCGTLGVGKGLVMVRYQGRDPQGKGDSERGSVWRAR